MLNIPTGKALVLSKVFVQGQLNGTCGDVQSVDVTFPSGTGTASYSLGIALIGTSPDGITRNYRSDTDIPWTFLPGDSFRIQFSTFDSCQIFTVARLLGRLVDQ